MMIKCENLTIAYEGNHILENVAFDVFKGDYLCVIGENGSGKSSLIKTILGLVPLKKGSITFSPDLKQKEIGYLPQQTTAQKDFPASVYEIVLSGFLGSQGLSPFYSKKKKQFADSKIDELGITHLKHKCFRELSGGEKQRTLIARCLCAMNKIIVLDEPTSGLDVKATSELYYLIKKLNKQGVTIIMVTHDLGSAKKYASHILEMNNKGGNYYVNNN